MIDSSRWETIRAGLLNAQEIHRRSISLEEGEGNSCGKPGRFMPWELMVVMAFDEAGQRTTLDRKIAICRRAYQL